MVIAYVIEEGVNKLNNPSFNLRGWSNMYRIGGTDRYTHNRISKIFTKISLRNRHKLSSFSNPYFELGQYMIQTAILQSIRNKAKQNDIIIKTKRTIRETGDLDINEIPEYITDDEDT